MDNFIHHFDSLRQFLDSLFFFLVLLHNSDFSTTVSQNRFSTYKLSLHKKTDIVQKKTENIRLIYFFNLLL